MKKTDLSPYLIDLAKDYRKRLKNFKLDKSGNLWFHRAGSKKGAWEILIPRDRLLETGWVSHMNGRGECDFGEFLAAYFVAVQRLAITPEEATLKLKIYGFDDAFKYAGE